MQARVGQPELKVLEDSADKEVRWVQLNVPIDEGPRFKVGQFSFDGNTVIKSDFLRPLYKLQPGDFYNEKRIRDGLIKSRELYGGGGYFEFTGFPDLAFQNAAEGPIAGPAEPTVNVTMRMTEGEQYFVNRITFTGNTTTRDNVIRREMRLVEGGVFNTEALKFSVRRLNQLGYFKNIEEQGGQGIDVQKTPNSKNEVDVTLKLEEQNRNQLTFGAGVSQFEGFFGQLSFQTANFLGRGEIAHAVGADRLARRELPAGLHRAVPVRSEHHRRVRHLLAHSCATSTSSPRSRRAATCLPDSRSRTSRGCSSPTATSRCRSPSSTRSITPRASRRRTRSWRTRCCSAQGGKRTISKVTPSFVHNTVDNPIFPTRGRRITSSIDLAGAGGDTNFIKPTGSKAVQLHSAQPRVPRWASVGRSNTSGRMAAPTCCRSTRRYISVASTASAASTSGRSVRAIHDTGLVLGGNKSLLFNAEYLISIAGPVRLILFYDAGQVATSAISRSR